MSALFAFVLSDVRSGSTLLDQCLGAHPQIVSLGEVHWLGAYIKQDRRVYDPEHPLVCSCGRPVGACPFWTAVAETVGRPLASLQLHSKFGATEVEGTSPATSARLPRKLFRVAPSLFRHSVVRRMLAGPRMAGDTVALFDAVARVAGTRMCIDSSKSPLRFRAVYAKEPDRTYAIVLSRDYRAVVHSKMKRGVQLEAAARGWSRKMRQIDVLTRDLPANRVHRLSYEALCTDPRRELARLCEFLGLFFHEEMLKRPTTNVHHIGGSPSKFDATRTHIELDRDYLGRFNGEDMRHLQAIVGREASRWGY